MTATALINGRVLTPGEIRDDVSVLVDGGRIAAVVREEDLPAGPDRLDLEGALLVPGFVDTQVNGGGGVLFNESPTVEAIAAIGEAHRGFGTTGFLPTLISDDLSVIRSGIAAVETAREAGVPGVLGIHIEGPFLSEHRKGIHDSDKFRRLDEEGFDVLTSLRSGRTLVTVAPECTTPDMIRRLVAAGVTVSAGHTNADYQTMAAGIEAGLTGITHLFNAMSPLGSREPGVVGAALESDRTWCGIIVDGHHVSVPTLKLAFRCKPADRFMLVTDAMPSVGSDRTEFELQGRRIVVRDGQCVDASGTLAGSHLDMASAVRNAIRMLDLPLTDALAMASTVPATFLGLGAQLGTIAPGSRADLLTLDDELRVTASWIGGERRAIQARPSKAGA